MHITYRPAFCIATAIQRRGEHRAAIRTLVLCATALITIEAIRAIVHPIGLFA